jgi:predicted Zn-dependent protease
LFLLLLLPVFLGLAAMLAVSLHDLLPARRPGRGGSSAALSMPPPATVPDEKKPAGMTASPPRGQFSQRQNAGGGPPELSANPPSAASAGDMTKNGTAGMTGAASGSMPDLREQADEMAALMRTLRDNPNDADNLNKIAEIFIQAGDWTRAEIFLNRALLSRPSDLRPRFLLGISLYRQNKIREAADIFEELLKSKEDPDTLYNLAVIRKYHLNDKAGAEELLRRLLALDDAPPETLEKARRELQ